MRKSTVGYKENLSNFTYLGGVLSHKEKQRGRIYRKVRISRREGDLERGHYDQAIAVKEKQGKEKKNRPSSRGNLRRRSKKKVA